MFYFYDERDVWFDIADEELWDLFDDLFGMELFGPRVALQEFGREAIETLSAIGRQRLSNASALFRMFPRVHDRYRDNVALLGTLPGKIATEVTNILNRNGPLNPATWNNRTPPNLALRRDPRNFRNPTRIKHLLV